MLGYYSKHAAGTEIENMSRAISYTSFVYLGAVVLLALALQRQLDPRIQNTPMP